MDILEPYDNNKSFTSCIERTSIAIGTSLTWSLVSSCQDSRLSVSSKSSQWTNFLSWGPNQTAIDVKILSIYINDLSSSNILHLGNWHKLWSGRNDCKKTTQLGKISFIGWNWIKKLWYYQDNSQHVANVTIPIWLKQRTSEGQNITKPVLQTIVMKTCSI